MSTVIRVENLGKRFRIGLSSSRYQTLSEKITQTLSGPWRTLRGVRTPESDSSDTIWALRNVSFDVQEGQVLGIIGRNGAGKSTLLKILSRITEPTEGSLTIRGRVGSLLEVGTGFHPELSGRENIFLNGAVLGMKRAEIERKFDEIVAFSEVERFIDTPVKRYSSGMYLRLAFAVAAHLEPEILVVDEVLAVGDAEFQKKCLGKMGDVAQQGRTVLFVSHNMSAVLRLTQESILLDKGTIVMRAPSTEVVDHYISAGHSHAGERHWQEDELPEGLKPFRPIAMRLVDRHGKLLNSARSTETMAIEVEYELSAPVTALRVGIFLTTMRGELVFISFDMDEPALFERYPQRAPGRYVSTCRIPADLLNGGHYLVGINASSFGIKRFFEEEQAMEFSVDSTGAPGTQWTEQRQGTIRPKLAWRIDPR